MNKLRMPKALGCPWHSFASGFAGDPPGDTRPSDGSVVFVGAAPPSFQRFYGPAVPILHPNAPGGARDPGQQLFDAEQDGGSIAYEHRAYGLAVGHTRSINGADGGVGIGIDRWLYCDPDTHATWLIRVDVSSFEEPGTLDDYLHFEIWLDGVFGWLSPNRVYEFTPRKLAELDWRPNAEAVFGGPGHVLADNIVAGAFTTLISALAFSNDGARCYINIRSSYHPTELTPTAFACSIHGNPWVGILQVDIAGSGTPADQGAAINATIVDDLDLFGGMITQDTFGSSSNGYVERDAILYRAPWGDVSRYHKKSETTDEFQVVVDVFGYQIDISGDVTYSGGTGHEVWILGPNAVYVRTYRDMDPAGNQHDEWWIGVDTAGTAQLLYSRSTGGLTYVWDGIDGVTECPPGHMVMSYDPVSLAVWPQTNLYTVDVNEPYEGPWGQAY